MKKLKKQLGLKGILTSRRVMRAPDPCRVGRNLHRRYFPGGPVLMKRAAIAGLLLAGTFTGPVHATGVPVVDAASIAQTITEGLTRAQEAASNLQQLKTQYDQTVQYAEDQKRRLEGFTDFRGGFDSAASYLKDSLGDITSGARSDLNGLRGQYGLNSNDGIAQARYDAILQKIKFYDDFNTAMRQRADRLTALQSAFTGADTPQKKADVANQLNAEKLTLDMQIKQYDIAERQMKAQAEAEYEQQRQQIMDTMLKH